MSLFVDIEKSYGNFVLKVAFESSNETVALLGPSGSGKSMTLKCIAGLVRPDRGKIILNGRVLFDSDKKIDIKPQDRRTALVFQNYALFPDMTVLENITCGAVRIRNKAERKAVVEDIIQRLGLAELGNHRPNQLSGGQQQRVALARALVSRPDILMLDEPFSALDSHLRFQMEELIRTVIKDFQKPVLFVSHNRDEVYRLSDSIAIVNEGKVEVFGKKNEVFSNPVTETAARLTGCKNISAIKKLGPNKVLAIDWGIELETAEEVIDQKYIGIRRHDLKIAKPSDSGTSPNTFDFKIIDTIENPFSSTIMVSYRGFSQLGWEISKESFNSKDRKISVADDTVSLSLDPHRLLLLK